MKYSRYPEYKDSGIEWLGEIPAHWEKARIKYTTYIKGRIGWKGLRSDEFIYEGPYLITGTDFYAGKVNWETCYHVSKERYEEDPYIQIHENDLLLTKDGTIGKVAIVKGMPDKACLNSGIFVKGSPGVRKNHHRYHPAKIPGNCRRDQCTAGQSLRSYYR